MYEWACSRVNKAAQVFTLAPGRSMHVRHLHQVSEAFARSACTAGRVFEFDKAIRVRHQIRHRAGAGGEAALGSAPADVPRYRRDAHHHAGGPSRHNHPMQPRQSMMSRGFEALTRSGRSGIARINKRHVRRSSTGDLTRTASWLSAIVLHILLAADRQEPQMGRAPPSLPRARRACEGTRRTR